MKRTLNKPKTTFSVKKLVELYKSFGWATGQLVGLPFGLNGRPVGKMVDRLGLERHVFHSYELVEPTVDRLGTG